VSSWRELVLVLILMKLSKSLLRTGSIPAAIASRVPSEEQWLLWGLLWSNPAVNHVSQLHHSAPCDLNTSFDVRVWNVVYTVHDFCILLCAARLRLRMGYFWLLDDSLVLSSLNSETKEGQSLPARGRKVQPQSTSNPKDEIVAQDNCQKICAGCCVLKCTTG
jgi:hypothetical protein